MPRRADGTWVPPGGSRLGKPNKLPIAIKDMILGALSDVGGRAYLARQAEQNPVAFLGLVGRVLPLTLAGDKNNPLVISWPVQPPKIEMTEQVIEAVVTRIDEQDRRDDA